MKKLHYILALLVVSTMLTLGISNAQEKGTYIDDATQQDSVSTDEDLSDFEYAVVEEEGTSNMALIIGVGLVIFVLGAFIVIRKRKKH